MSSEVATETTARVLEPVTAEKTLGERGFELSQREALALSHSSLVPTEYQGNVPNCLIAMNLAKRIGIDPMMVMQNLDVIHGRPSFRASFLIACVNMCGRFSPLRYRVEGDGDSMTCVAFATEKETGEIVEGPMVSMTMAKAEGWSTKKGSKWQTMPDLMIRYRAAAFFARTTAPEITLGLHTADELEDIRPAPASERPSAMSATEALDNAVDVTPEPEPEPEVQDEPPMDDLGDEGKW